MASSLPGRSSPLGASTSGRGANGSSSSSGANRVGLKDRRHRRVHSGPVAALSQLASSSSDQSARWETLNRTNLRPACKTSRSRAARRRVAPRAEKHSSSPPSSTAAADGDDAKTTTTTNTPQPPTSTLSAAELDARIDVARSTGRLDLSECGLTRVPDAVALLGPSLEDLSLAGNPDLEALPEWLGEALPSLARLQAAGCGLSALPDSITMLKELRGLWAHGCRLERLPEGIGALRGSLRSLSLAGNRLRELPPSVGELSSLEEAGLAGNRLRRLPKEFAGMASLRKLQLHGNLLGLAAGSGGRDDGESGGENDDDESDDASLVAAALAALPEEALAPLLNLTYLTLQSNLLAQLPECLGELPLLEDLNVADNRLLSLPRSLARAPALRRLTCYGNRIRSLPPLLGRAPSLRGLWLEGNPLCQAGGGGGGGGGREEEEEEEGACSLASGRELHALLVDACRAAIARGEAGSGGGGGEPSSSPSASSSSFSSSPEKYGAGGAEADAASAEGAEGARRRRVGLDSRQLSALEPAVVAAAAAGGVLAPACATLCEARRGYWKLEAGPGGGEWVSEVADRASSSRGRKAARGGRKSPPPEVVDGSGATGRRGLVVAFGSAPGEPNWGGLLSRIRKNASDSAHAKFDVLYVVDGARSWYNGGDDEEGARGRGNGSDEESEGGVGAGGVGGGADGERNRLSSSSSPCSFWTEPIAAAAEAYDGAVLLLGDSMGATGALLAAGAVAEACRRKRASEPSPSPSSSTSPLPPRPRALAFCPQVDLAASSIRPAESVEWMSRLRDRAVESVSVATTAAAEAAATKTEEEQEKITEKNRSFPSSPLPLPAMRVDVHVGSWRHDLAQALPLQAEAGATVKVWSVPSHRLAAALDSRGELEPLVRSSLLSVMGFSDGRGVRMSNVL